MTMASGGARARSGPAPDPFALRRDRGDDAAWVTLPVGGFAGDVPEFPLPDALTVEVELWDELWRKPQAFMWDQLGLKFEVAAYVRIYLKANAIDASPSFMTPVLRASAEIGLSLPGMHSLRWKFSVDEVALKRERAERVKPTAKSARERMAGLQNG